MMSGLGSGMIALLVASVPAAPSKLPLPRLGPDCLRPPTPVVHFSVSALNALWHMIRQVPDSDPDKAEVYFGLATYWRTRADRLARRGRCQSWPERAVASSKSELQALRKRHLAAVHYYLAIARGRAFTRYHRLDEVLYRLVVLLFRFDRPQWAYHFLVRLFTDHPQSRFIARAYLALADDELRRGHTVMAFANYEEVARRGGPLLRGYARYKTAWCWMLHGDSYRALEHFVSLIQDSRRLIPTPSTKLLMGLARRDVVVAFSKLGDLRQARSSSQAWRVRRCSSQDLSRILPPLSNVFEHLALSRSARK